ncbi:hypothetical protein FTUN_4844 [Frigoriglobus tundricola]|uniref:Uncharacterized protein n=1 Tax=Frigoriglobus tundricola TaxID=2774151 RepID=A0A6M5YV00_9BACT|nr:hypothetical protein FTUN_4844 [Frigoriglobus tundricola]
MVLTLSSVEPPADTCAKMNEPKLPLLRYFAHPTAFPHCSRGDSFGIFYY